MEKQIILFTDGSEGSEKATVLAVELANLDKTNLTAYFIIDSGWGSLLGDEWISTSKTRMRFYRKPKMVRAIYESVTPDRTAPFITRNSTWLSSQWDWNLLRVQLNWRPPWA